MLLDSGASVNILDKQSFGAIAAQNKAVKLQHDNTLIYAYGATKPLLLKGKFQAQVSTGEQSVTATFHVAKQNAGCLLGYETAVDLELIQIPKQQVNALPPDNPLLQVRSLQMLSRVQAR